MRSPLTDRQHDNIAKINEYIIEQVRRKIEPLCIRVNKRNFKSQMNSPRYYQASPSLRKTKASQPLLEALNKSIIAKRNRRKMLSTAIIIEKQKKCNNFRHTLDPNDSTEDIIKYEELRNKVQRHIQQQIKKIGHQHRDSKKYLRLSNNIGEKSNYICFNRSIVTTAVKPYNFRQAFQEIKKTERRQKNEQIFGKYIKHDTHNSAVQKIKMTNQSSKQQQKDQQIGKQNVEKSRFKKQKKNKNKQKKKAVGFQKIKRKNSLLFATPQNDDIDKQFEEGLVEQIYTTKRIKFRKKINQIKSRKNLVEGNLYFLKQ